MTGKPCPKKPTHIVKLNLQIKQVDLNLTAFSSFSLLGYLFQDIQFYFFIVCTKSRYLAYFYAIFKFAKRGKFSNNKKDVKLYVQNYVLLLSPQPIRFLLLSPLFEV